MSLTRFIARRYEKNLRQAFSLKLLRWIGLSGIALGVFSLIAVLAVMRGFEQDFQQKILGFQAPLNIEGRLDSELMQTLRRELAHDANVSAVVPRVEGELVIETSFGTASGLRVRGTSLNEAELPGLGRLEIGVPADQALGSHPAGAENLPGIILGAELAATLQVRPEYHDEVQLVFPFGEVGPTGEVLPRLRRFVVIGIFDSGFYEYDSKFALIAQEQAQRLMGEYGRENLAVYLNDFKQAPRLQALWQSRWPDVKISSWQERNERLWKALQLERLGMLMLLMTIILLASFSIFALLSIIVLEKVPDMAILRTLGLTQRQVRCIFWWQVLRIGWRGTCIGAGSAIMVCVIFHFFPYPLPPSYYIPFLPVALEPLAWAGLMLIGPLVSFLAGLYPARQATRFDIAEVFRRA